MRVLLLLAAFVFIATAISCGRNASMTTASTASAYSDGFEVVVLDTDEGGVIVSVQSLPLGEAEQAIEAGATALLPIDPSLIEQQLSAGTSGDFRTIVSVETLGEGKQHVRLSFHESKRTFVYEYVVDGTQVTPVASAYRDLAKSKSVRYVDG